MFKTLHIKLISTAILLWIAVDGFGQNPYFNKAVDIPKTQMFVNTCIVDSSVYIFGLTRDNPASQLVRSMTKCDFNGDTLFTKQYLIGMNATFGIGRGGVEYANGSFYIPGWEYLNFQSPARASMTKLNEQGDSIFYISMSDTTFSGFVDVLVDTRHPNRVMWLGVYQEPTGWLDIKLVASDTSGNIIWTKQYGGIYGDQCLSIDTTSDGGYILAGYSYISTLDPQAYMLKVDSVGNIKWQKSFGGVGDDLVFCRTLSNGEIIVYGLYEELADDSYIAKYKVDGSIIWEHLVPVNSQFFIYGHDILIDFIEHDDNYYFLGEAYHPNDSIPQGFIMKTDTSGHYLWHRWYKVRNIDNYPLNFKHMPDDGFLITGFVFGDGSSNDQDGWLVRTNCLGFLQYPTSEFVVSETEGTTLAFKNQSKFADEFLWDFGDGDTLYQYSEPYDSLPNQPQVNHKYVIPGPYEVTLYAIACGDTTSTKKIVVAKPYEITEGKQVSVYPNPTSGELYIWADDLIEDERYNVKIFDITGKLVLNINEVGQSFKSGLKLELPGLNSGTYSGQLVHNESKNLVHNFRVVKL